VLTVLSRGGGPLMILLDRTMINDPLNLLYVAVSFGGRARPLGLPWWCRTRQVREPDPSPDAFLSLTCRGQF